MIRLALRCRPELAEQVLAELVELAPGGVEEERGEDYVELAIYGPPGELPELPALEAAAGPGLIEIATTEIPDDWADRWRDFHRPVAVAGGRIVIHPPWDQAGPATNPAAPGRESRFKEPAADAAGKVFQAEAEGVAGSDYEQPTGIVIEPGQAFGTGAHATTRMCLELLVELADTGRASGALADLGTGSGVLAIAAARLGWAPVVAVDSEAAALAAAAANAAANGVEVELARANLRTEAPPRASTVLANLTAPLLGEVAARLDPEARTVVCSGLLGAERDAVVTAFVRAGLGLVAERVSGEWMALQLERDSDGRAS